MRSSSSGRLILLSMALLLACVILAGCGLEDQADSRSETSPLPSGATGDSDSSAPEADGDGADASPAAEGEDAHEHEGKKHPEIPLRPNVNSRSGSKGGSGGKMGAVTPVDNIYSAVTSEVVVSKPELQVLQSAAAFNALKKKQFGQADAHPRELHVDFKGGEQVIAVFAPRGTVGARVEVTKVETDGQSTRVTARLSAPVKDCGPAEGVEVRPTTWVVTRTLPKNTTLKIQRKTIGC